jgi:hypothetical protein
MITTLALWGTLAFFQGATPASQLATYRNDWIGISITHPANWKVVEKKTDAWVTIPLKEGTATAALNLVAATFNADPEIWQFSQKDASQDLGFEILKQWQEEILGVPLLLTKVRSGPGKLASAIKAVPALPSDQPLVTVIGLVYSRTPRKLLFRLTAPESAFDDADFAWKQVLETLKTSDGNLPQPEDPKRKPDPLPPAGKPGKNEKPEGPPKKTTIGASAASNRGAKVERAPKVFEATAANKKIGFYYPEGWTIEKGEDGQLSLKNTGLSLNLRLWLNSTLDSDPPLRALVKASAETLKSFEKVETREENMPKPNKAGATMVRIVRIGKDTSGPIWTFESAGGSTDFYFLITGSGKGKLEAAELKALEDLVERASVEPVG